MNFPHYLRFGGGLPFVDSLAQWLLAQYRGEPLDLARTLVLLPTRRACRSLRESFLRESNGAPMLLPRIMPIGEVDGEADITSLIDAPPMCAMPEKMRLSTLTRFILQTGDIPPARAFDLAVELARLLDEATRHDLGFDALRQLVKDRELAMHWEKTVAFLSIITSQWPAVLAEKNMVDGATLTRTRIQQLAREWKKSPPDFPVVAAGSTGSIPATALLLDAIAHMPRGRVILPGLDAEMDDESWKLVDATHPQHMLKNLLEKNSAARTQVACIHNPCPPNATLRAIFAPAALTAAWRGISLDLAQDLSHIRLMEAPTQIEEARMIACQLRAALEQEGKTAALVTPDRTLARMVSAECARWGIAIDDSAGKPLSRFPAAVFMRLIFEAVDSGCAPGTLLALLRHPFMANGKNTAGAREYSRTLEEKLLRGVRFAPGTDTLMEEIRKRAISDDFTAFFARLRDAIRPLEMLFIKGAGVALADLIRAHALAAEQLAATDSTPGGDILWAKEDGMALSAQLAEWADAGAALGNIRPRDYPALFDAMISRVAVRAPFGTHPRLHILGPIEARLIHYDTVILGGMNEGTWPAAATVDPWMSAEMRDDFGLPPHAISIGQSAHDVWMLMHAPQVILSRARKSGGVPQQQSRWWARLVTLVEGRDKALLGRMDITRAMQATLSEMDAPYEVAAISRPEPSPPVSARPRSFSPSSIDLWSREPYAFYAKKILGLKALDPLDQEPDNREFGEKIHAVLERFSADYPKHLPDHAYQRLLQEGEILFREYQHRPAVIALWQPRFEAIARHWLSRERQLRGQEYETRSEVPATWTFDIGGEDIALNVRADRVDMMEGTFRLMDYKTGTPPKEKAVREGDAKQLPLTALALMRSGTIPGAPSSLVYWALKTREGKDDYVEVGEPDALLQKTEDELRQLVEHSLRHDTSYPAEKSAQDTDFEGDYDHLIRRAEWGGN